MKARRERSWARDSASLEVFSGLLGIEVELDSGDWSS